VKERNMTFVPIGRTQLQAGEALHMAVDARTVVHVTQGVVMLREPPAWLAQRVLMPSARLEEGQAHEMARAGWIEVAAEGPAEIAQYRPAGLMVETLGALMRLAGRARGVRAEKA
jgi:hypothetical protein